MWIFAFMLARSLSTFSLTSRRRRGLLLASALLVGGITPAVHSAEIRLFAESSGATVIPGMTYVVQGSITNITGADLSTDELFLSISGYPLEGVAIDVLLGLTPRLIPDRTVVGQLDLFSITLSDAALVPFALDVFAMDVNGNFSEPFSFSVSSEPNEVPEPGAGMLVLFGLAAVLPGAFRQKHIRLASN